MADITFYNTTDRILDVVLDTYTSINPNLTVSDVVKQSIVKLTTYNSNMAAEYRNGSYNTGFAKRLRIWLNAMRRRNTLVANSASAKPCRGDQNVLGIARAVVGQQQAGQPLLQPVQKG